MYKSGFKNQLVFIAFFNMSFEFLSRFQFASGWMWYKSGVKNPLVFIASSNMSFEFLLVVRGNKVGVGIHAAGSKKFIGFHITFSCLVTTSFVEHVAGFFIGMFKVDWFS
jgi:hypothetical protein